MLVLLLICSNKRRQAHTCMDTEIPSLSLGVSGNKTHRNNGNQYCWRKWDKQKYDKWAKSWQNQHYDMCVQRRLGSAWASAQSDQSLLWAQRVGLFMQTANTLIRRMYGRTDKHDVYRTITFNRSCNVLKVNPSEKSAYGAKRTPKQKTISNSNSISILGILYSLCRESRDVGVVFIEIVSSHDDVLDSNIKIFWKVHILTKNLTNSKMYAFSPVFVILKM